MYVMDQNECNFHELSEIKAIELYAKFDYLKPCGGNFTLHKMLCIRLSITAVIINSH